MTRRSEARVETRQAERYVGQICKHFAHRLPVDYAGARGRIAFPFGACTLDVEGHVLTLRAEAPDDGLLAQLELVMQKHLMRVAFRDRPEIDWIRAD